MNFDLTKPCANCPFLREPRFYLHPHRVDEIRDAMEGRGHFACHKTVDYDTEDGEPAITRKSQHCAGALIVMEKEGTLMHNQLARIANRLGWNPDNLEVDATTYDTWDEMRETMEQ